MIDDDACNRLAEGIRHLAADVITNVEFEERSLSSSADPAIRAVFVGGPWFLYHDLLLHGAGLRNMGTLLCGHLSAVQITRQL